MLAQRMAQLEQEKKHKDEIVAIREEQIRMLSQLMLLNASAGNGQGAGAKLPSHLQKQQAEIMHNIQKLIDKPIIIQAEGASLELSYPKPESSYHERSQQKQPKWQGFQQKHESEDDI